MVLLSICIVAIILMNVPDLFFKNQVDVSEQETKQLDSLAQVLERKHNGPHNKEFFNFDPNLISVDSLILLGVDEKIADRINNYRNKGAHFISKRT